mgnify:CR=1 FL=1
MGIATPQRNAHTDVSPVGLKPSDNTAKNEKLITNGNVT